jgi:hypothetical protein
MIEAEYIKKAAELIIAYGILMDGFLIKSKALLLDFASRPDLLNFLETEYNKATNLLEYFNKNRINRFDPFRIAGFVACEDNFSNVIAAIFNPRSSHGLGNSPLKLVLNKLLLQKFEKVQPILKALEESNEYHVNKRPHRKSSHPDIVISSDRFIIYIENKLRGRSETIISGKPQTARQKEDLQQRANQTGVHWLGIFLTPEYKPPMDEDFLSLSAAQLVSAIREALDETDDHSTRGSIEAFLNFYSWTN